MDASDERVTKRIQEQYMGVVSLGRFGVALPAVGVDRLQTFQQRRDQVRGCRMLLGVISLLLSFGTAEVGNAGSAVSAT